MGHKSIDIHLSVLPCSPASKQPLFCIKFDSLFFFFFLIKWHDPAIVVDQSHEKASPIEKRKPVPPSIRSPKKWFLFMHP
jgi:hypothetical protein